MRSFDVVVKIGGGLMRDAGQLDGALSAVQAAATRHRMLIVPGGGTFADAVRDADYRFRLSDDTAHWMALLAMDQYAHLVAGRMNAALATHPEEIPEHANPAVLAPYRWLREVDPLPHSWSVTSDSIAAWIAGQVGARRLVLVKPAGTREHDRAVDEYFARARPPHVSSRIVPADRLETIESALSERSGQRLLRRKT